MLRKLQRLFGREYESLNTITISSVRLVSNYRFLSSINSSIRVAPVLKSNAYGHGLTLIAKELSSLHPPFFCVDSLFEAYELFKAGITIPILVMGFIHPRSVHTKKLPFSFAVYNKELAQALSVYQPHAKIHIFVDTGMRREGVRIEDLPRFIEFITTKTTLTVEGVMSHFGISDKPFDPQTKKQMQLFKQAKEILQSFGIYPKWIHIANSDGLLHATSLGDIGNVARVGIALYGIPQKEQVSLKPILSLSTMIGQVKMLKKGERLGYDFTYQAKKDTSVAILPLGYYDGVDRRLSNKGHVLLAKTYCPIIGRVSMNITTIDISKVPQAKVGDTVTIFSDTPSHKNSLRNSAKICQTIPYELLIHLAQPTKRILKT